LSVQGVAIGQGVLHPKAVKGRTVEDAPAAESEVREDVRVRVHDAVEVTVLEGGLLGITARIEGELGMLRTSARVLEGDDRGGSRAVGEALEAKQLFGATIAKLQLSVRALG